MTRGRPISTLTRKIPAKDLKKLVKIVVVDDEPSGFPLKELQDEGYTIEHWESVKSLDRLERGEFDIIVLDIAGIATHLTEKDGLGVLERVKRVNADQLVLAISAQTYSLSQQDFFELADDHLAKPADVITCKQILDDLIEESLGIERLWDSVAHALRGQGVEEKKIKRLERDLVKGIQKGKKPDLAARIRSLTDVGDLAVRVAEVGSKIFSICVA